MYLIMRCNPLSDQFECDADRKPITMTDDYLEWYNDNEPDYRFEVYEYSEGTFNLVKEYDNPIEEGMALAYFPDDSDEATVIKAYPGLTRHSIVPNEVMERATKGDDYEDCLYNCGHLSWYENSILHCYVEYEDSFVYNPY